MCCRGRISARWTEGGFVPEGETNRNEGSSEETEGRKNNLVGASATPNCSLPNFPDLRPSLVAVAVGGVGGDGPAAPPPRCLLPFSTPPGASPRTSARRIETIPLEPDPADTGEGSAAMTASSFSDAFPNSRKSHPRGQPRHPRPRAGDPPLRRRTSAPGLRHQRPAGRRCPPGTPDPAPPLDRGARRRALARESIVTPAQAGVQDATHPGLAPAPGLPRPGSRHPTALRAAGRSHPRNGVRRPPRGDGARVRAERGGPRAAPSSRPTSTIPRSSR